MPAINRLAKATSCPKRFVFELEHFSTNNKPGADNTGSEDIDLVTEEQTMGVIFESIIQHIMTGDGEKISKSQEIQSWLKDVIQKGKMISLNELDIPWNSKWNKEQNLKKRISRSQWLRIKNAVTRWIRSNPPWKPEDGVWSREYPVEAVLDFTVNGEVKSVKVWGRADLFLESEEQPIVLELKMTSPRTGKIAKAQAALYTIAINSTNSKVKTKGFVYHSKDQYLDAYTRSFFDDLIVDGVNREVQPYSFNCKECPNLDCNERFIDGR